MSFYRTCFISGNLHILHAEDVFQSGNLKTFLRLFMDLKVKPGIPPPTPIRYGSNGSGLAGRSDICQRRDGEWGHIQYPVVVVEMAHRFAEGSLLSWASWKDTWQVFFLTTEVALPDRFPPYKDRTGDLRRRGALPPPRPPPRPTHIIYSSTACRTWTTRGIRSMEFRLLFSRSYVFFKGNNEIQSIDKLKVNDRRMLFWILL